MDSKKIIGFYGYPKPEIIQEYKKKYPDDEWIDLDVNTGAPEQSVLPDACCSIIKNIINNAFFCRDNLRVILAASGNDKCTGGLFTAEILQDAGFNTVKTVFENKIHKREIKIASSNLPLRKKAELIMQDIIKPVHAEYTQCRPAFGFWGVPPDDISLLELFPDNTHIYGWMRCVEARTPADTELEMYIDKDVPVVFYTQSFCSKAHAAKYLADKYGGLYIDAGSRITNSIKAKIEAFLRLR